MSSFVAPLPRIALFDGTTVYKWSDGNNFNGFVLIALVYPVGYTQIMYGNFSPSLAVPQFMRVPIINGQANTACGIFLNADLVPDTTQYVAWYYDTTNTQIAGPTVQFTVTTQGPFTPPILTLPVQSSLQPPPTPDS